MLRISLLVGEDEENDFLLQSGKQIITQMQEGLKLCHNGSNRLIIQGKGRTQNKT